MTGVGQGRRALRSGKRAVSARERASGSQCGSQSRGFAGTLSYTIMSSPVTVTCSHMTFSPRLHWCPFLVFRVHALYLVLLVAHVRSVVSGVSARCVCCGCSLVGSDASRCRVCAEDACGVMANSGE